MFGGEVAGEEQAGTAREEAVAEPTCAFAARAIGEDVGGVLRIGLAGGLEDLHERGIGRFELRAGGLGILVGAQMRRGNLECPVASDRIGIPERVGFERFNLIFADLGKFPRDDIRARVARGADLAID